MRLLCCCNLMFMCIIESHVILKMYVERELMDMSDAVIDKLFKFVVGRTNYCLGELCSDTMFVITKFIKEFVIRM